MKITTILPVSRIKYLDRVLDSIVNQTQKPQNLVVIFDGSDNEYVEVRNKIAELDIENKLCVPSVNERTAFTVPERRMNITRIHNQFREILGDCDWVFSVEDDSIIPPDALRRLCKFVKSTDNVGMVTGVELGRWGVPYVGAWKVDDLNEIRKISSMPNRTAEDVIEGIDACGLYCALINAEYYKQHEFFTNNGLGPDVNLGIFLRKMGFQNYIDWSIHVVHLTSRGGFEIEIPPTDNTYVVNLERDPSSESTWRY